MAVELVDYKDQHAQAFRALNYAWIEQYFRVEPSDRAMLEAPRDTILNPGGYIVMALVDGEPVGTCALLRHPDGRWELAKMAVADAARGRGIGYQLGRKVLDQARQLGAGRVFLESNTCLEPALALYRKLGFKTFSAEPSPYARCNIQMEVVL